MLTTGAATVKFALPMTPEQQACSAKIDEGLNTFWKLVEHMQHAADQQQPIVSLRRACKNCPPDALPGRRPVGVRVAYGSAGRGYGSLAG